MTDIKPDNEIGSTVEVRFTNIPGSSPMKGKVDTGADISSLHATEYTILNNNITFVCPELSHNKITIPLTTQQQVKSSDGGMEYRPVVTLNVKVNGKLLTNVEFNLNDRGNMEFPILIGKNLLIRGGFKIDPKLDEHETLQGDAIIDNPRPNTQQDRSGIVHIYRVEEQTTDESVNNDFTQNFAHVQVGNSTYIIRYLGYEGKKLNPTVDGDEILYVLDAIENGLEDGDKEKIQDFTNTAFDKEEHDGNT